jgi:hypothetical protein
MRRADCAAALIRLWGRSGPVDGAARNLLGVARVKIQVQRHIKWHGAKRGDGTTNCERFFSLSARSSNMLSIVCSFTFCAAAFLRHL